MKRFTKILCALTLAVALCLPGMAFAWTAVGFSSPGIDFTNGNWSLGWGFTANSSFTVNSLGFYNDSGLTQSHEVGIFNSSGGLLVEATVTPTDPLSSFFRWNSCASTLLSAGQTYYIMAVTGSDNYTFQTAGFVVNPDINFIQDYYYYPANGALTFPNGTAGFTAAEGGGIFGPNFSTTAVPIPGALWLLGSGLVGLAGLRRKFKR
ncbi:MAG: VPLPA-CTERM sorting domain-containing protein [Desulfobaccales bacterium]